MNGSRHFDMWEWVDFVRNVGDEARRRAMDAHLSSGCRQCRQIVQRLRKFATMAAREVEYEPSAAAVRRAEEIFVGHAAKAMPRTGRKISMRRRAVAV